MTYTDFARTIEKQLAESNTENACSALLVLLQDKNETLYQQVILLAGQFNDLKRNKILGLDDDTRGMNRVNNALIQLCSELKREFGSDIIDTGTQKRLNTLPQEPAKAKSPPSVITASNINFKKWIAIAAAIILLFAIWRTYNWLSNLTMLNPDALITQNSGSESSPSTATVQNTEGANIASNLPEIEPKFIDFKAKSQNVEIYETRLYPTDGVSRLVFYGKFYCGFANSGGCNIFDEYFSLLIDGQTLETKNADFNGENPTGTISSARANAHYFFKLSYDVPSTAQSVALQIKLDGKTTLPIDLKKIGAQIGDKPKVINLTDEKDLKISKNFGGGFQLLSVKAAPYDDNFFQLTVRISKCIECDFYDNCIRIVSDKGGSLRSFTKSEILSKNNESNEIQFEFILPRTLVAPELMVGNCNIMGQVPFKVALGL